MTKYLELFADKAINGKGDNDSNLVILHSLVLGLKSRNILELGFRDGDCTLPLLSAAQQTGGILNSVFREKPNFNPPNELKQYWKFHLMNSIDYLKTLNQQLDLIFIDDWHDGKHVYTELKLIEPWVNKKSIILLHDTMHSGSHPNYRLEPPEYDIEGKYFGNGGPYGALLKLKESPGGNKWEYSTIPCCHGLTILRLAE